MTEAEQRLWLKIKDQQILGEAFYSQYSLGDIVVDFYCPELNYIIECEAVENSKEENLAENLRRDLTLTGLGMTVSRFSSESIMNEIEVILQLILQDIKNLQLHK